MNAPHTLTQEELPSVQHSKEDQGKNMEETLTPCLCWWRKVNGIPVGLEPSLKMLESLIDKEKPIGIFGFSQGAALR